MLLPAREFLKTDSKNTKKARRVRGYNRNMRPLDSLRDGWESLEDEKARLLARLSVSESVAQYLALQQEFESSLQASERFFREERMAALTELQHRLLRLNTLRGNS
jgi:hypothetical protein